MTDRLIDPAWRQQEPPDYEDPSDDDCRICGAPTDDGEGWDGLCGNCADPEESRSAAVQVTVQDGVQDNHDRQYDAMYSDRTEVADNDMVE